MRAATTYKLDPERPLVAYDWLAESPDANRCAAPSLRGLTVSRPKLEGFSVLVLGAGAVNSHVVRGLAQLGVGTILVCDPDRYDAKSHWTQPVRPGFDGVPKVQVQCAAAHELNPHVRIVGLEGFAQDLPRYLIHKADIWLLSGDNLDLVVWTARQAMELGKVVIEGAVYGELSMAFVRRHDLRDPSNVCPSCNFKKDEWNMLHTRRGCSMDTAVAQGTLPTQTAPPLSGLAAQLVLNELTSELSDNPQGLDGEELAYCAANHKAWRTKFTRNENCRLPHRAPKLAEVEEHPEELTLGDLLNRDRRGGGRDVQVKTEMPWFEFASCNSPDCEAVSSIRRFARLGSVLGQCGCGGRLLAGPVGKRSVVPPATLQQYRDVPMAQLGLRAFDSVSIATGDDKTIYFLGCGTLHDWLAANAQRPKPPTND